MPKGVPLKPRIAPDDHPLLPLVAPTPDQIDQVLPHDGPDTDNPVVRVELYGTNRDAVQAVMGLLSHYFEHLYVVHDAGKTFRNHLGERRVISAIVVTPEQLANPRQPMMERKTGWERTAAVTVMAYDAEVT